MTQTPQLYTRVPCGSGMAAGPHPAPRQCCPAQQQPPNKQQLRWTGFEPATAHSRVEDFDRLVYWLAAEWTSENGHTNKLCCASKCEVKTSSTRRRSKVLVPTFADLSQVCAHTSHRGQRVHRAPAPSVTGQAGDARPKATGSLQHPSCRAELAMAKAINRKEHWRDLSQS